MSEGRFFQDGALLTCQSLRFSPLPVPYARPIDLLPHPHPIIHQVVAPPPTSRMSCHASPVAQTALAALPPFVAGGGVAIALPRSHAAAAMTAMMVVPASTPITT